MSLFIFDSSPSLEQQGDHDRMLVMICLQEQPTTVNIRLGTLFCSSLCFVGTKYSVLTAYLFTEMFMITDLDSWNKIDEFVMTDIQCSVHALDDCGLSIVYLI